MAKAQSRLLDPHNPSDLPILKSTFSTSSDVSALDYVIRPDGKTAWYFRYWSIGQAHTRGLYTPPAEASTPPFSGAWTVSLDGTTDAYAWYVVGDYPGNGGPHAAEIWAWADGPIPLVPVAGCDHPAALTTSPGYAHILTAQSPGVLPQPCDANSIQYFPVEIFGLALEGETALIFDRWELFWGDANTCEISEDQSIVPVGKYLHADQRSLALKKDKDPWLIAHYKKATYTPSGPNPVIIEGLLAAELANELDSWKWIADPASLVRPETISNEEALKSSISKLTKKQIVAEKRALGERMQQLQFLNNMLENQAKPRG